MESLNYGQPGVYVNLPNGEYHSGAGISKSDLDAVHKSPAYWLYRQNNPQTPTFAMTVGSAVHCAVLEPEKFEQSYTVAPDFDRRTKAGKADYAEWLLDQPEGIEILDAETMNMIRGISESLLKNPIVQTMVENTVHEVSVKTMFENMLCKCRPDGWNRDENYMIDLKTTQDASAEGFRKTIYKFRYHVQAAWYRQVVANELKSDVLANFYFIAVEKTPPYSMALYQLDADALALGWAEALDDFRTLKKAIESNVFQGYEPRIQTLSLPRYAYITDGTIIES